MQYVMLIHPDESKDSEVDWYQIGKDYDAYAAAVVQAGVMRGGQKPQPSVTATTVAVRGNPEKKPISPINSPADISATGALRRST